MSYFKCIFASQSAPKMLLDLIKETVLFHYFIITLEKLHITDNWGKTVNG